MRLHYSFLTLILCFTITATFAQDDYYEVNDNVESDGYSTVNSVTNESNNQEHPQEIKPQQVEETPIATESQVATQENATPATNTIPQQETTTQEASTPTSSEENTENPQTSSQPESGESDSESGGFGFQSGLSIGYMNIEGEQRTRISYRPELSIGSFGVAFDIEVFLNSEGQFIKDAWDFSTQERTINTLLRKIYYVRWNQPGDKFYIRAGAIENITLDHGLITNNFGNIALYPAQKQIGIHTQFNNMLGFMSALEPFNVNLELVTNSIEDWTHKGGVIGGKISTTPIGMLPLPIISDLRIGASAIGDVNQYATSDRDGDNCPDRLDQNPSKKNAICQRNKYATQEFIEKIREQNSDLADSVQAMSDRFDQEDSDSLKAKFGERDAFALLAFHATLPIIQTEMLSLTVYSEYAQPLTENDNIPDSYGLIPLGASMHFLIFDVGLEYRQFKGAFYPGHFDYNYEAQRAVFENGSYKTKEERAWVNSANNYRQGIYGRLGANIGMFANLQGSYSHLFAETGEAEKAFTFKAAVGQNILEFIPKINKAYWFYNKDRIGQDVYTDSNGNLQKDGFVDKSIYTTWGYRIGFELGTNMNLDVGTTTTYTRDEESALISHSQFAAETVFMF